jgi:putative transposase
MNPIRAGMARHPIDYRWSSYRHHIGEASFSLIEDHEIFQRIVLLITERVFCYQALFRNDLDVEDLKAVRKASSISMPLGDSDFKTKVETTLGRSIGYSKRGSP